jgi:hypothetical protein
VYALLALYCLPASILLRSVIAMRIFSTVLLTMLLIGCDAASIDAPIEVSIRTDHASYTLDRLAYGHRFTSSPFEVRMAN